MYTHRHTYTHTHAHAQCPHTHAVMKVCDNALCHELSFVDNALKYDEIIILPDISTVDNASGFGEATCCTEGIENVNKLVQ